MTDWLEEQILKIASTLEAVLTNPALLNQSSIPFVKSKGTGATLDMIVTETQTLHVCTISTTVYHPVAAQKLSVAK